MTEPRRDRWGRYLLPDPITGEERAWTRATTWANTLSDPWGLVDWKLRMAIKGVAMRDDLRALAHSLPLDSGKKQLNEVARDAIEAAGGSSGRNMGTALHEWTAQADRGEALEVPSPWDADLGTYRETLALHGIRTTDYVERIVCLPDLGVAGTFDRIVAWDPHAYIADVKTGGNLEYAWGEIAVQLALYANAEYVWDDEREAWYPMDGLVDRSQGLVIHLPPGQAKCELWWVDLELGWSAALLASDVREWRKRKDIARPFGVDLLGRSPVQPVLDLARDGEPGKAKGPTGRDTPTGSESPAEDSPAAETEGTPTVLAPAGVPAGDGTDG